MRAYLVLASLVILAGCSGRASNYERADTPDAKRVADFQDCRSIARAATARDRSIDTDIVASRGADWKNRGVYSVENTATNAYSSENSSQILMNCMLGKGYSPAR